MVSDVPRTRPAYPPEFRREAIELLRQGRTPGELAKSLAVSPQTLRNWRRQDQLDHGERDDGRLAAGSAPLPWPGLPATTGTPSMTCVNCGMDA